MTHEYLSICVTKHKFIVRLLKITEALNYEILFQSKPFSLPMIIDFENKKLLMEVDLQYCIPKLLIIDVYFYTVY